MYIDYMNTPIGTIEIQASSQGITKVVFSESEDKIINPSKITHSCKQQLQEYFDSKRKKFDLPLDQQGTLFQKSIWACLTKIPFGQVVSYLHIAKMANNPKAVRAVGAANGKNPIGIIVPCHRVIGSNGTLTGYAGGLNRKDWLLKHEGIEIKNSK
ncbi:Methylated-DNA--protein-cysteine methyltransferase [hydrothermal vent metagenome]|uniref:Methylated-DNA--protein-cysteine methyltransferase n=1 Tax=hydrothermal vent metagenome TaxID=652676 RepID=A0A3B1CX83_9ZZZZ